MHIPTVKVKSPGALGYRIINQHDLKPHHELWVEQDADFTSPAGTAAQDATLVEIAVRIADKLLASKLQVSPVQWVEKPLAERVEQMLIAEREIDDGIRMLTDPLALRQEQRLPEDATTPVHVTTLPPAPQPLEAPHASTAEQPVQQPVQQPAWKSKPKGK